MTRIKGGLLMLRCVRQMLMRMLTLPKRSIFATTASVTDDDMGPMPKQLPEDIMEGDFVVHTINDGELTRLIIELDYLAHSGFMKLLEQAKEEFGFKQAGVLAVPCTPNEL